MQVEDKLVKLGPGMVTVEIKTGRRRIIGYLLLFAGEATA